MMDISDNLKECETGVTISGSFDKKIADLALCIFNNGNMVIETPNEGALAKLYELRGTPISWKKTLRDHDYDYAIYCQDKIDY